MTGRLRIVVATTHFPLRERGDVTGNFVVDPVLGLADRIDQTVVTPLDEGVAPPRERFAGQVPVHRFRYWWPRREQRVAYRYGIPTNITRDHLAKLQLVPFVVVFAIALIRAARRADVIHAHWLPVALVALPARWLTRTPIVVTLHGTDVTQFPDRFVSWALRRVDAVISAHEDLLRAAERLAPTVPRHRVRHLVEPQPVDDSELRAVREILGAGPTALFVGRLSPERDPLTFVRAAAVVRDQIPEAAFALVGDGPLSDAVDAEIRRLGLEETVHAFGYRKDVWTFLRAADAFATLATRNNIWVTAMVEAMRAGVPVVATTAGDTTDVLTEGENVLLAPIGDVEAVGAQLTRLLADPELGRRLAQGATRRLAEAGFDPETVKDGMVAAYRSVLR